MSVFRFPVKNASTIPFDNTDSGLAATDVQEAIDEIVAELPAAGMATDFSNADPAANNINLNGNHLQKVGSVQDFTDVIALNVTNRIAADSTEVSSVDWENRKLFDSAGVETLDWNTPVNGWVKYSYTYEDFQNNSDTFQDTIVAIPGFTFVEQVMVYIGTAFNDPSGIGNGCQVSIGFGASPGNVIDGEFIEDSADFELYGDVAGKNSSSASRDLNLTISANASNTNNFNSGTMDVYVKTSALPA